jgi:uncharacterized protein YdgA (DUF945 family)
MRPSLLLSFPSSSSETHQLFKHFHSLHHAPSTAPVTLLQHIDFIPLPFQTIFHSSKMLSNLIAALALASLAMANPLVARQAADTTSAPKPTLITTTIAGTCNTPWLTASLKAGKSKTINSTKIGKSSSTSISTYTPSVTVTPHYVR